MRILVDTNIIIDALTGREPFREAAEQVFLIAANRAEDMYIAASSVTDIYYLVRKHLHSTEQSKDVMSKLFELFYILDVTSGDCMDALASEMKDYEDAVITCCAYRSQVDYIVTRNIKDYAVSKVRAILPEKFVEIIWQGEE
jgi:predicted nucleic acid-binding protein